MEPAGVSEDGRVDDDPSVTLDSGLRAVIRRDRWVPGAYELVVDGTRLPEDLENWQQWVAKEKP